MHLRASLGNEGEQLVESSRSVGRGSARQQIDARKNVPTKNEYGVARREQRLSDQPEVVGAVLDTLKACRAFDAPAVLPGLENRVRM
jgi:hypothetical protein